VQSTLPHSGPAPPKRRRVEASKGSSMAVGTRTPTVESGPLVKTVGRRATHVLQISSLEVLHVQPFKRDPRPCLTSCSALRPEVVSVPRESVVVVLPFGVSQTQELLLYSVSSCNLPSLPSLPRSASGSPTLSWSYHLQEQTRDFPRPERPRSDQSRRPIATGLEDGGEERKKG
jgi:hypothetical protein